MSNKSDNNSDSDFEDPDLLEVPGGGKNLAALAKSNTQTNFAGIRMLDAINKSKLDLLNANFVNKNAAGMNRMLPQASHLFNDFEHNSRKNILTNVLQLNNIHQLMVNEQENISTKQDANFSAQYATITEGAENVEEEGMGVAETYANYVPSKLKIGMKHPDPVVESTSLSSVEPVNVWYELVIPKSVINNGLLSALQLEAITYACQQHEIIHSNGMRGGFLIGDGAGVGKGRTIAGLIYENYLRGRKKSIWISVMNDLKYDSERDLNDIGALIQVHHLNKLKYSKIYSSENGDIKKGVLFCTYSTLIAQTVGHNSEFDNRLDQIIDWCGPKFDGVIVFDECHRAKNLYPNNCGKATKTGLKVLQMQLKLPLARVVYASATGATEPSNMAYMIRLNMWGEGTPYPDFNAFLNVLQKRGVGAMEIVAMDMKLKGLYIARQLSFQGVIFKVVEVPLTKKFVNIYNRSTKLWNEIFFKFQEAVSIIKADKSMKSYIWGQFWLAHQRFFRYMCISAKVAHAVLIARDAIKCGKCIVVGLQSTGEARTLSQLEKEDGELCSFVSTAQGVLTGLVENHFPACSNSIMNKILDSTKYTANSKVGQYTRKRKFLKTDDNASKFKTCNYLSESDSDSEFYNNWQINKNPVATNDNELLNLMKEDLLKKIKNLSKCLPPNALDELIDELGGPDNVAEMTGRKGRIVHNEGSYQYEARSANDVPLEILNLKEKQRFMDGEKDVAVISEAASSGISLHSDKRAINRKSRVHITLELPWSADKAIQQFGRTHRSNQSNAPEYILLISELGGERRFASVVAKRLESLGALTQGDRRATEARDLSKYNIDNNYGRAAVELSLKSIIGVEKPVVQPPTNYKGDFMADALQALMEVGMIMRTENNTHTLDCDRKMFGRFLNRILGIHVELQNAIFNYFTDTMEAIIERAKKFGQYDLGILDIAAEDKLTKRIMVSKFQRKEMNATVITELHEVTVERGMSWESAFNLWSNYSGFKDGFYYTVHEKTTNKEIILAILEKSSHTKVKIYHSGNEEFYTLYRPNVGQQLKKEKMKNILKKYKPADMDEAQCLWVSHYESSLFTCSHIYWKGVCKRRCWGQECDVGLRNKTYYILSGSVLSIWSSLESIISSTNGSRLQVVRIKTKDGSKIVGTLIPSACVEKLRQQLVVISNTCEIIRF